jgi:hypothetical protein
MLTPDDVSKIHYVSMNNDTATFFDNQNQNSNITNVVYVTAFYNINRGDWGYAKRNIEYYLDSFKKFISSNKNIIAFIDERYINHDMFINYIDNVKKMGNNKTTFIPINMEWLLNNCETWRKNHISEKIMNSDEYKNKVQHRINVGIPENIYSSYNTINHCKIDFIKYAIDNHYVDHSDFICWCDFGYYNSILKSNPDNYPYADLDLRKMNHNKLNFCLRNKIGLNDLNMYYTLVCAPEVFTGSFFAGNIEKMNELYYLYHVCLDELYNNNISDDDQHVYLRCFMKNPDLFELFLSDDKWPEALTFFQKKISNRFEFINYHIRNIQNGKFVEIGVCQGSCSKNILENNNTCKLYCVDPYISYNDYDDACNNIVGDNMYFETQNMINRLFPNRSIFLRKFSKEASYDFDADLDFVYIDGNHKFEYVYEDINIWYDKIKVGGILICDDAVDTNDSIRDTNGDVYIEWCPGCDGKYGVIFACKKFTQENQLCYFKYDTQILIYKPLYLKN